MCYGKTGGDYPIALLCVVESQITRLAQGKIAISSIEELCSNESIIADVMKSCAEVCKSAGLADFETPKRIGLLAPVEGVAKWTPENDMLTAAMKLKRPQIVNAFKSNIDALYS